MRELSLEKLSNNVSIITLVDIRGGSDMRESYRSSNISSRGEIKMSCNDITFGKGVSPSMNERRTAIDVNFRGKDV